MMKKLCWILIPLWLSACVSTRKYEELLRKKDKFEQENGDLTANLLALETKNRELNYRISDLLAKQNVLEGDTARLGREWRSLNQELNDLERNYNQLLKDGRLSKSDEEATRQLIRDLQKAREELQAGEDALRLKEKMLITKRDSLVALGRDLSKSDARVQELERMLRSRDSASSALRTALEKALSWYNDQGLRIVQKDGKVYVMMEERLLFQSGSTKVDPKGIEALKKLSAVLAKNPDISILVEGHTDVVPMKGVGEIKDNWDLSVMRATSVTKIILEEKGVFPQRITAAGRGEYLPVDPGNSAEARKKNRRIEIILEPRLEEIYRVLRP